MKVLSRRSIVALDNIKKNESFTEENVGARRPGNGIPANMIGDVLGKKSTRNIAKGNLIKNGDFNE